MSAKHIRVNSPNVTYGANEIISKYTYTSEVASVDGDTITVTPESTDYEFKTSTNVGKVGLMLVGWGGNNGSTVTGSQIANKEGLTWETRSGTQEPNYFGSLTQASTLRMGRDANGDDIYVPFSRVVPMVNPNDIFISGWDISKMNLADCMDRSRVFEPDLIRQLKPKMEGMVPLPSLYYPDFIAANQSERADNVIEGDDKMAHLEHIRKDIRDFKSKHDLNTVVVLWTANTERFADIIEGVNDTEENLMAAVAASHPEVAPSTIFALASILEGAPFVNGSPQNTFVPGVVQLAESKKSFIAGDDFKSGQTKMKSVLVDFLVGAGIKPISITSYNHLGNNDGKNLSAPSQFRSKEISKSNVVDDMVASNEILFEPGEHPDHVVVIKYVPAVGDSKRALDEYVSEIFMGGRNTISMHNTCEDSLLASPLIFDLAILAEFCTRVEFKKDGEQEFKHFHPILSLLSYLLKAPLVKPGTPVVNALNRQRAALENIMRACIGLAPQNDMLLADRSSD